VQIVRAAASPAASGPSVAAPKLRSMQLEKGESAWYDDDADVVIVVSAAKKAQAQKLLGSFVKH